MLGTDPSHAPAVLIVDDEQPVRAVLTAYVQRSGYRVLEARNVDEAVQVIEKRTDLRLVVTDINMPGPSGLVLVERARASRPELRFIVISAALPRELPELRCLKKPFRLAELRVAIQQELATISVA